MRDVKLQATDMFAVMPFALTLTFWRRSDELAIDEVLAVRLDVGSSRPPCPRQPSLKSRMHVDGDTDELAKSPRNAHRQVAELLRRIVQPETGLVALTMFCCEHRPARVP